MSLKNVLIKLKALYIHTYYNINFYCLNLHNNVLHISLTRQLQCCTQHLLHIQEKIVLRQILTAVSTLNRNI